MRLIGILVITSVLIVAAACSSTPTSVNPAKGPTPQGTTSPLPSESETTLAASVTTDPAEATNNGAVPGPTTPPNVRPPTPTPEGTDSSQLPDDPRELMGAALDGDLTQVTRKMGDSGNRSYIPVLIDLLRFTPDEEVNAALVSALSRLIGQPRGSLEPEQLKWGWWLEWLGDHPEVRGPDGYTAWKGKQLSSSVGKVFAPWTQLFPLLDTEVGEFLYSGVKTRIRIEEIVWGGVVKDGIPHLSNPPIISAEDATYLEPTDRVFGVSVNGEHRAYPLRILNAHEMANDSVGGVPVALAYCTLCGSGVLYSTKIDGQVLEFRTSGLLFRSNKLMYDRATSTLWQQFTGEPVLGPLADSGIKLEVLPVSVTTWGEWLAAHPDTGVLDNNTGIYPPEVYRREDDGGSIYFDYRQSPDTRFPVAQRSDLLATKAEVLGLVVNGLARAYPLELLQRRRMINDSLGGSNLVVITNRDGSGARAYERGPHRFSLAEPGAEKNGIIFLLDQTGRRWLAEEEALVLAEEPAQRLQRLPSHVAFWFAWYTFYSDSDVYGEGTSGP